MLMAGVALYSSSPPATIWTTAPNSVSCSATSLHDADGLGRSSFGNSAGRPLGGLSGLFSSPRVTSVSSCSLSDSAEYAAVSWGTGFSRNSSQTDLAHNAGTWEIGESRGGAGSTPSVASCRLKERSPVSVFHGPSSRSSHHNSPVYSLISWDNVSNSAALPPLDPHAERHSRRRSSITIDERRPMSRSVGFEVRGDRTPLGYQPHQPCDEGWSDSDRQIGRKDGFIRAGDTVGRSDPEEAEELQETRRWLSRLAESPLSSSPPRNGGAVPSADELLLDAKARHKIFEEPLVVKAFWVAEEAHRNQLRRSGDLYLSHCVETALLLAQTGADSTVVASGLLHDTLDDSSLSPEQLRVSFGSEVEYLVSGVSKLSTFSQLARDNDTAGNPVEADRLRTMFIAMVDVRVVLIKLADRLHNLRTLDSLAADKQLRIAEETLEIFAPLANRLGIWSWKAEIEDTCFKYLNPEKHEELASKMAEGWQEGVVLSCIQQLEDALRVEGVEFSDICGRPKNLYSIYKKMLRKGRTIDEIFDVRGVRLIVKDTQSCFIALEVVHRLWRMIPKKDKDYISHPKPNGYQSLHTVIVGDDGHPMEIQIRTMDMHHQAEYGMAAHWRYKENNSLHSAFLLQKVEWARWVLTWHSEILDTKLRVSSLRSDIRPCPFPVHSDDCPYGLGCALPPQSEDDPLFVIVVEDNDMSVQELAPGSTAADLLGDCQGDRDSISASSSVLTRKWSRTRVNHRDVKNLHQRLKMGDLVELSREQEMKPLPLLAPKTKELEVARGQAGKLYGQIALEFQREQLKRLYLDDAKCGEAMLRSSQSVQEQSPSVASFS